MKKIIGFYTDSKGRKRPITNGRKTGTLFDYMPGKWKAPKNKVDPISKLTYKPLKRRGVKCVVCGGEAIARAIIRRSRRSLCRKCLQEWFDRYKEYMEPSKRELYIKTFGLRD